jgi:hypothetical protein
MIMPLVSAGFIVAGAGCFSAGSAAAAGAGAGAFACVTVFFWQPTVNSSPGITSNSAITNQIFFCIFLLLSHSNIT